MFSNPKCINYGFIRVEFFSCKKLQKTHKTPQRQKKTETAPASDKTKLRPDTCKIQSNLPEAMTNFYCRNLSGSLSSHFRAGLGGRSSQVGREGWKVVIPTCHCRLIWCAWSPSTSPAASRRSVSNSRVQTIPTKPLMFVESALPRYGQ